ncbi:hypothetical protein [Leyella stercorea]|uniref:hypothetical protein n=2 Tax=Leyella stercorea TaxID=363265 RepID=UPI0024330475|nr:hypothetical protein [Leyella stercorea]
MGVNMLTYTAFLHLYPHPRRSMQTSAPVDADIRAGRCRHPRRSMQTSASVDADRPKPTTTLLYVRLKIKEVIL